MFNIPAHQVLLKIQRVNAKPVALIVNLAKMEIHVLNVNQLILPLTQGSVGSVELNVEHAHLERIALINSIHQLEMVVLQDLF